MKRFLWALILCLFAIPALAGMNMKQNGDGSTDWEDASGNRFNVAAGYLSIQLEDVSAAGVSAAAVVPMPNASITNVYAVLHGTVTGTATINVYAGTGITAGDVAAGNEVSNATDPMTLAGDAGDSDSLIATTQNSVDQGDIIIITTDGGSTNAIPATIIITLEPNGT